MVFDFLIGCQFFFSFFPKVILQLFFSFPASNIPGAITTLLHSSFGQRVSVSTRMGWSLSVLLVAFSSLLALSIPNSDLWQERFLHLTLMLIVLANVGVNVLQVIFLTKNDTTLEETKLLRILH